MLKKILSVFLSMIMIFGVFTIIPFPAFANSEIEQSNVILDYYLNADDTACITGCYGNDYDFNVIIPSYIEGHKVTSIGRDAFRNNEWILSVTLPDTVTSIGDYAFLCCDNLHHVSLGIGLEEIGEYSFQGCDLKEIELPESLTTVGEGAFIGGHSITSLRIPKNVTSIGVVSFPSYTLERIEVDEDNLFFDSRDNCNAIIATGTNTLICGSNNTIIPDTVTRIGPCAFECCNFSSINLPESVSFIDSDAFLACYNLSSISMPGVTQIYSSAFNCTSLSNVSLPKIHYVGHRAFSGCPYLRSVYFGKSLYHLDIGVFGLGLTAGSDEICGETPLTDIYYEGNEEEWGEVRIDKTYYETNQNIFDANMHYLCSKSYYDNLYFNVLGETFEHDLQWFAKNWNSTKYNPELAHLMMTMSELSYSLGESKKGYKELGLKDYDYKFYFEEYADYGTEKAPFNIGWTSDDDGTICILISIKGSGDIKDFAQGFLDWMGNASVNAVQKDDLMVNENFYNTMQNVYDEISKYYDQHFHKSLSEAVNTKLFITGHSRGAAVANFLEIKLGKEVGKENVYGYNFAVPDTVVDYRSKDMQTGYENIFNISNVKDEVSFQPGLLMHQLLNLYFPFDTVPASLKELRWKKCGVTVWYSENGEKGAEIIKADDFKFDREAHMGYRYLRYMRQRNGFGAYFQMFLDESNEYWNPYDVDGYQIYMVCCPVDVELLDKNGKVIVSVVNNKVDYHGSYSGEAMVAVIGDEKAIAVAQGKDYSLRLVGSDTGTMDYLIGNVDMRGKETELNYNFTNVELTTGKQMLGKTVNILDEATKTITREEKLLLMDGQGNTDTEILANGEETDYNVKYILGDADNNGSIDIIDATFIQRKLADLDTPYTDEFLRQGDADGSGELDVIDVTMIQRYLVGLKIPYLVGTDVV